MAVTTSSDYTTEPGETSLTLNYPSGSAGDTLLVWLVVSDLQSPTVSGQLDAGELVDTIQSTGKLRVYKRIRQAGDTSATWAVGVGVRMAAVAANLTADLDDADPATAFVGTVFASVTPTAVPNGPGLLAVWWSFSEIDVSQSAVLEAPDPDADVTVGMELRLYRISAPCNITEAAPTNPSNDLFIRAVSYTTFPGGRGWTLGSAGWT